MLYKVPFEKKINLLHINFRNQLCIDEIDLVNAFINKLPKEILTKIKNIFPEIDSIKLSSKLVYSDAEFNFKNKEKKEKTSSLQDLQKILEGLENTIYNFSSLNGEFTPVLFIDEANRLLNLENNLNGKIALDYLIQWIIMKTKEEAKIHIILATSD